MKVLLIHNKDITMEYLEDILKSKCIQGEVIVALPDAFTLEVMRNIHFDMVIGSIQKTSIGVTEAFLGKVKGLEVGDDIYTYMAIEKETLGMLNQDFVDVVDDFISLPLDSEEFGYRLAKASKRLMKRNSALFQPLQDGNSQVHRVVDMSSPEVKILDGNVPDVSIKDILESELVERELLNPKSLFEAEDDFAFIEAGIEDSEVHMESTETVFELPALEEVQYIDAVLKIEVHHEERLYEIPIDAKLEFEAKIENENGVQYKSEAEEETLENEKVSHEVEEVSPDVEEVAPELEAVAPELEAVAPELEAVAPEVEEVSLEVEELSPEMEESSPEVEELSHEVEEVSPDVEEVAPELEAVAPEAEEVAPEFEAVAPEAEEEALKVEEVLLKVEEVSLKVEEVSLEVKGVLPELEEVAPEAEEVETETGEVGIVVHDPINEVVFEPSYDELLKARELRRQKEKAEYEKQDRLKWERIEESTRRVAAESAVQEEVVSAFGGQAVGEVMTIGTVSLEYPPVVDGDPSYHDQVVRAATAGMVESTSGFVEDKELPVQRNDIELEEIPCEPSYEELVRENEMRLHRKQEEARRQSMAKKFSGFNQGNEEDEESLHVEPAAVFPIVIEENRPSSKVDSIQEEIDLLKHLRKDCNVKTTKMNTAKFKKEKKHNAEKRQKKEEKSNGVRAKVSKVFLFLLLVVITTIAIFFFTGEFEGGLLIVNNLDSLSNLWGWLR